jgi:sulfonate transport system permease protein
MASTRGLGFMLTDSQNTARPDLIVLSMLMLAVLGKLTDMALRTMEGRLLLWRDTFRTDGSPA